MVELALLALCLLLSIAPPWILAARRARRSRETLQRVVAEGLDQPPSLHPVIDPTRCIGTGACVSACPEGDILGLVEGRGALTEPTRCIGHGECQSSCPVDAIELVFGTAKRGVDIPHVRPNFETNVPGIYIVGELGGMGLIRNAMIQGLQAVQGIARDLEKPGKPRRSDDPVHDLVIVGAGPAGLAASLAAKEAGLRFRTLEQDAIGGTVFHYPRRKLVMTAPIDLPFYGRVRARETTKEELLDLWMDIIDRAELEITTGEGVRRVDPVESPGTGRLLSVETDRGHYLARRVILAIGRRGTPRRLEVPGEERPTVAYSLANADAFRSEKLIVVGGGNSALEALIQLADPELGNHVTLSYRGEAFGRAAERNRELVADLERTRRVEILRSSRVRAIHEDHVELLVGERAQRRPAGQTFIFVGGVIPTAFLRDVGVHVETKFGSR